MSYFNINPRLFSTILPGDCHRLFHCDLKKRKERKREKDCSHESVSMAPGLKEALSMVLMEKGTAIHGK